jgi:molybdenum cofactor biosynthesis enzyme MoaA
MIIAAVAKLNQYSDTNFQAVMDQISAAQEEGLSDFELDVRLLDDDEIQDLVIALECVGYTANFNHEAWLIEVQYE